MAEKGYVNVDNLYTQLDEAISELHRKLWLTIDRLDVAFDDTLELERTALRALFRCYLDLKSLRNVRLKIFLRTDIWKRVVEGGFREATHLTRDANLNWTDAGLLNLIARRLLSNEPIRAVYEVNTSEILEDIGLQRELIHRVFPDQVRVGERQSTTFDWILKRTGDSVSPAAPREIIAFLNALRQVQITRIEQGRASFEEKSEALFERAAFEDALPAVSEYRIERNLYAENPGIKEYVEKLREKRAEQTLETLREIWELDTGKVEDIVGSLVAAGFFQERQSGDGVSYWIPFVFRPYLKLVQGKQ